MVAVDPEKYEHLSLAQLIRLLLETVPERHCDAQVGQRIKQRRLKQNMSQRQLAHKNCSAAYISRLEAGERIPSWQLLRRLATALSTTPEWLSAGIGPEEDLLGGAVLRQVSLGDPQVFHELLAIKAAMRKKLNGQRLAAAA